MKTKNIATLSAAAGLPLVLGTLFLAAGCAQEEPPMPRGIYVPAPAVKTADQQTSAQPASADAAISSPSESTDEFKKQLDAKDAAQPPAADKTADAKNAAQPPAADKTADAKNAAQPPVIDDAAKGKDANVPPAAKTDKGEETTYVVQKGDSLWKISRAAGLTVNELAAYNNIDPAKPILIGQKLKIPAASKNVKPADPAAKNGKTAKNVQKKSAKKSAKKSNKKSVQKGAAAAAGTAAVKDGIYVVQKGDSFTKIASRLHVKVADIEAANPGVSSNRLQVGQKLNVPAAGTAVPAAKKSAGTKAEASTAVKAVPADIENDLLKDIPNPDQQTSAAPVKQETAPAEDAAKQLPAATAASPAPDTAVPTADTTVEALAAKYGVKADDVKIMNPSLPADGKIKAGTVVRLP